MAFLNYAKDYMNDVCSDLCDTIQLSSESLVQNVKTWYTSAGSASPEPSTAAATGGQHECMRYRRKDIDFVVHSQQRNGKSKWV